MLLSMTGHGIATLERDGLQYTVEIKSVNSKQFDLNLRLPSVLQDEEFILRERLLKQIYRGKVFCVVDIQSLHPAASVGHFDPTILEHYYHQLAQYVSGASLPHRPEDLLPAVLTFPEVLRSLKSVAEEVPVDKALFEEAFAGALQAFLIFRQQEGTQLQLDIATRIQYILDGMKEVARLAPARKQKIQDKFHELFTTDTLAVDANRLEQELIFYVEKLDITEELVRLDTHCRYFQTLLNAAEAENQNGKKLGFLIQEIGREINTIGSKANDAAIQHLVVAMKDELEKIKEQLLNVL